MSVDQSGTVNTSIYLQGATVFGQYQIENRLLTVIGVAHTAKLSSCGKVDRVVTVPNYVLTKMKQLPTKLLLEYTSGMNQAEILTLKDIVLTETYQMMVNNNIINNIIPVDTRASYLTREDQDALYHSSWKIVGTGPCAPRNPRLNNLILYPGISADELLTVFINPFLDDRSRLIKNYFKPDANTLHENDYKYLLDMITDIRDTAYYISKDVVDKWNIKDSNIRTDMRSKILEQIRHLWKKLVDYYIILSIFQSIGAGDNCIVIVGGTHAINIHKVFERTCEFFQTITSLKDCINIKGAIARL